MVRPDWIAVDWGTSRLRAWAMSADGAVLTSASRETGMGALAPAEFEPALLAAVGDWIGTEAVLVIACGMVGARQGWTEAAYAEVPCPPLPPGNLTGAPASDPRLDVRILPGLCQQDPADVMRGEETQIAGLLSTRPGFEGTLCLPGTHTKWVRLSDGQVTGFRTAMTGEMFALLSGTSVLRHSMDDAWDDAAFDEAVLAALDSPASLPSRLFAIRAEGLVAEVREGRGPATLSGALIGTEIAGEAPGGPVVLIGDARLSLRYQRALGLAGVDAETAPSEDITLDGLRAAHRVITGATP